MTRLKVTPAAIRYKSTPRDADEAVMPLICEENEKAQAPESSSVRSSLRQSGRKMQSSSKAVSELLQQEESSRSLRPPESSAAAVENSFMSATKLPGVPKTSRSQDNRRVLQEVLPHDTSLATAEKPANRRSKSYPRQNQGSTVTLHDAVCGRFGKRGTSGSKGRKTNLGRKKVNKKRNNIFVRSFFSLRRSMRLHFLTSKVAKTSLSSDGRLDEHDRGEVAVAAHLSKKHLSESARSSDILFDSDTLDAGDETPPVMMMMVGGRPTMDGYRPSAKGGPQGWRRDFDWCSAHVPSKLSRGVTPPVAMPLNAETMATINESLATTATVDCDGFEDDDSSEQSQPEGKTNLRQSSKKGSGCTMEVVLFSQERNNGQHQQQQKKVQKKTKEAKKIYNPHGLPLARPVSA